MEIVQAKSQRAAIISLLAAEKLPTKDLPEYLDNFLAAIENGELAGLAGLEVYGNYGLLRSLVVSPSYRGKGIADELIGQVELMAAGKALVALYLLTETAAAYFERKGYRKIERTEVPVEVQHSSEFSHVCPVSATVMKKSVNKIL